MKRNNGVQDLGCQTWVTVTPRAGKQGRSAISALAMAHTSGSTRLTHQHAFAQGLSFLVLLLEAFAFKNPMPSF